MIIFLPVRNGGAYLTEAIDSIVTQRDTNWRLILLENASIDKTVAMISTYQDSRITLLTVNRPLGIYENWHRIWTWLEEYDVTDQLVTMIGHDDALNPDFVGIMRALATRHSDATLYQSSFDLIDTSGNLIRPSRPVPQVETWQELAAALCWGIRDSFGTGYVFRARDYRRVGGIPDYPSLLYSDHLLFVRLTRLNRKVATDARLCRYRLHSGSASNSLSRVTVNAYIEALDGFVSVLTGELKEFAATELGRDATACLIGRQLVNFDRLGVRDLLSSVNRARLLSLKAVFAGLSPEIPPESWAGMPKTDWSRRLRALAGTVAFVRVRLKEGLRH